MKIENFYIESLFGCREVINIPFDSNIHVLSGKNGAGKTTILKLIWYFISGNLEKALIEVPFRKAVLDTDIYKLTVTVNEDQETPFTTKIEYKRRDLIDQAIIDIDPLDVRSDIRHVLTKFIGSSFFFPTFRNIEGGFTTEKYNFKHEIFQSLLSNNSQKNPDPVDLVHDLKVLSSKLSNHEHKFVTSVSASNINELLISRYAETMSLIQPFQAKRKELSDIFFQKIKIGKDTIQIENLEDQEVINQLQTQFSIIEEKINDIRKPIKRFHESTKFFLKKYDFKFSKDVKFSILENRSPVPEKSKYTEFFGIESENSAIFHNLSVLSAGEKQILSLISYNAFFDNTIFFIDEPEISLHADWQRILFRILIKQNPTNQFIITTQSPFIYSKYPKNEVCVDPTFDRGDTESRW